jgi:hypothetical protein
VITSFVTVIIVSFIILLFANGESISDYIKIKNNIEIDHIESWIFRALCTGIPILLINIRTFYYGIILLIGMAFLFSLVFRTLLNLRRRKKITYISNSNIYDSIFIKLFKKKSGNMIIVFEIFMILLTLTLYIFL